MGNRTTAQTVGSARDYIKAHSEEYEMQSMGIQKMVHKVANSTARNRGALGVFS